ADDAALALLRSPRRRRRPRGALHRLSRAGDRRHAPERPVMAAIEVKVPDIGDFTDIPVIEVFVKPGDTIKKDESIVTLESDKATMDVPSTQSGTVKEVKVKLGAKVSQGSVLLLLETSASVAPAPAGAPATPPASASAPAAAKPAQAGSLREALSSTLASLDADFHAEVLVLGAGPGGYT